MPSPTSSNAIVAFVTWILVAIGPPRPPLVPVRHGRSAQTPPGNRTHRRHLLSSNAVNLDTQADAAYRSKISPTKRDCLFE